MKKKIDNFWYHYKAHTLITLLILILAVAGFKSCSDKQEIDLHMAYMSTNPISQQSIDAVEKSLAEADLLKDLDGDGAAIFYMDTVVHNFNADSDMDQYAMQKVQTILYAGTHTITLAHQYALEDYDGSFEDISDYVRDGDKVFESPEEGFVSGISVEGNKYLESLGINTENLYVAMRRRTNAETEKNTYAKEFENGYEIMEYILEQTGDSSPELSEVSD